MGTVSGISYLDGFDHSMLAVSNFGADKGKFKHVKCIAARDALKMMTVKTEEEMHATNFCGSKAHALGLPMSVVDSEYQFDRRKLTFYFTADR